MDLSVLNKALDIKTGKVAVAKTESQGERIIDLDVDKIKPDPDQPRKTFDAQKIQELADDIRQNGLIQPIIVRMDGLGSFIVVAGERRLKAVQLLKAKTIKAIIQRYERDQLGYIQMSENIKRDDLRFYEMADFIIGRIAQGEKQSTVADKLGISKSEVTRYMTWQDAPDFLREAKDKFSAIRAFADLVNLAKDYGDKVKDFVKDSEGSITLAKVTEFKKALEHKEDEKEISENVSEDINTDSNALSKKENTVGNENLNEDPEDIVAAKESDTDEESDDVNNDSNEQSLKTENVDIADEDISLSVEDQKEIVSNALEESADTLLKESENSTRFKKPLIMGHVDGREAVLLYKEIPSTDGMIKVKFEDGFEDEILAEQFTLNRICEA